MKSWPQWSSTGILPLTYMELKCHPCYLSSQLRPDNPVTSDFNQTHRKVHFLSLWRQHSIGDPIKKQDIYSWQAAFNKEGPSSATTRTMSPFCTIQLLAVALTFQEECPKHPFTCKSHCAVWFPHRHRGVFTPLISCFPSHCKVHS